ncbi:MAG: aminomethyl-transferring glycine dehydrogenase subunit GcvPB [Proteobacteria bacterium]|nr:aminomethyl-transferring glycine dehydrogenase subunit GcvPB [Pseudomonadota bacterium]
MSQELRTNGIVQDEPLLWEKGRKGRDGYSMPLRDVEKASIDESLLGDGPDFPDLSEVDVVRHYTRLSQWNFGVDTGMYPLGSCTMKYNPKINEKLSSYIGLTRSHPLLPAHLSQGTLRLLYELESYLCEITGMDAVSLQPAAGAHGELAGMLIFHAYHKSKGKKRNKILIPDTAHGTNPASASLCGFQAVVVKSSEKGILSHETVAELMDEDTAGIMVTNPNTLGLFEKNIRKIADIVHEKGGLVYADGANMNAVMGIVQMGKIGVDVMHLNLHKTFSTPHGGGGPGAGPVCVKKELEKFLPVPRIRKVKDAYALVENIPESIGKLHTFYGNFSVLVRAYCYILSMGPEGLKAVSQHAVLNANYIKEKLKDHFHIPYDRPCMHECVFTDKFQEKHHVSTLDIAKRMIDYGIHPPTIYFPLVVHGAMMIEPPETESKEEIDRLIAVLKIIAKEAEDNPEIVRNAPQFARMRRLDEVTAARKPVLIG